MLKVEGLTVAYGPVYALRDCSLEVPTGTIVTLLGANGAGKTTLLHAVTGLVKPIAGTITFDGRRLGSRPDATVRAGLSLVPEHRQLFPTMTVEENLRLGAYSRDMRAGATQRIEEILALFPELVPLRQTLAAMLSGGQQQMLAIGRALMAEPRLLLLDEPSLGLAPRLVDRVLDALKEINARGVTILLIEQNAFRTLPLSDTTYVLDTGRIVIAGPSSALIDDPRIRSSYLGTL